VSNFTVVYDACVLYPAPLRDLLMELALTDSFRARWSEEIHQEWIRNVLKNRSDLNESQLLRTKAFMDAKRMSEKSELCQSPEHNAYHSDIDKYF
jgi:hypothetical protein